MRRRRLSPARSIIIGGSNDPAGNRYVGPVTNVELYNPFVSSGNNVGVLTGMGHDRMYHSSAALQPDGKIKIAGGQFRHTDGSIRNRISGQHFIPWYMTSNRPVITGTQSGGPIPGGSIDMLYNSTFKVFWDVDNSDEVDIAQVTLVRLNACTHSWDSNQRWINMTVMSVNPSLGEIVVHTPKNSAVAPPGHYKLYGISSQGVPSMAKYIRIG